MHMHTYVLHILWVDLHHPCLCQLLYLSSVSCCFGPTPSCQPVSLQRRSNTVFPLNQMKKVKRRTWLPEPESSARTPRTSPFFLEFNTTKVPPLHKKLLAHHGSTIIPSQKHDESKEFRITTKPLYYKAVWDECALSISRLNKHVWEQQQASEGAQFKSVWTIYE